MKILLVYPAKLDEHGKPVKFRKAFFPPLALAILSRLTPEPHTLTVVNDYVEEIDHSADYDIAAITAMTSQIERAYDIADRLRERGVKVIIGGMHATALPAEAHQHADSVVIGEVEDIWENILDDYERGTYKEYYRAEQFPDLQKLIVPRYDAFNMDVYYKPRGQKMPAMPVFSSRGCPYGCDFCSVSQYFGRTYRIKPVKHVLAEIEATGAAHYNFIDDNIAGNAEYSKELFQALTGRNIRWFSQISTNVLKNPELIDLAAKAGCYSLFIGIESINSASLNSIHKGFNRFEQYEELFGRMRRAGIAPWVSIIFGFDTDTDDQFELTLKFLLRQQVAQVTFFILTPFPGTKLYEQLDSQGRILHKRWSLYDASHVVFQPKNYSQDKLLSLYWNTYREFYSIANIIKRVYGKITNASSPAKRFLETFPYELVYRNKVYKQDHPFMGGLE